MNEDQVKAIADIRTFMDERGCSTDLLTDEQLIDVVRNTFVKLSKACDSLLEAFASQRFILMLKDETRRHRRQRRLLYRKKKSQSKRRA